MAVNDLSNPGWNPGTVATPYVKSGRHQLGTQEIHYDCENECGADVVIGPMLDWDVLSGSWTFGEDVSVSAGGGIAQYFGSPHITNTVTGQPISWTLSGYLTPDEDSFVIDMFMFDQGSGPSFVDYNLSIYGPEAPIFDPRSFFEVCQPADEAGTCASADIGLSGGSEFYFEWSWDSDSSLLSARLDTGSEDITRSVSSSLGGSLEWQLRLITRGTESAEGFTIRDLSLTTE